MNGPAAWNCGRVHKDKFECLPLATLDGQPIHNARGKDLPADMLSDINSSIDAIPGTGRRTLIRNSALYNCMGLVFGSRRTTIDINEVHDILTRDRYELRPSFETALIGDVVVYFDTQGSPVHVGFVYRVVSTRQGTRIRILSKWSEAGEYVHDLEDYRDGKPRQIWTPRAPRGQDARFP